MKLHLLQLLRNINLQLGYTRKTQLLQLTILQNLQVDKSHHQTFIYIMELMMTVRVFGIQTQRLGYIIVTLITLVTLVISAREHKL